MSPTCPADLCTIHSKGIIVWTSSVNHIRGPITDEKAAMGKHMNVMMKEGMLHNPAVHIYQDRTPMDYFDPAALAMGINHVFCSGLMTSASMVPMRLSGIAVTAPEDTLPEGIKSAKTKDEVFKGLTHDFSDITVTPGESPRSIIQGIDLTGISQQKEPPRVWEIKLNVPREDFPYFLRKGLGHSSMWPLLKPTTTNRGVATIQAGMSSKYRDGAPAFLVDVPAGVFTKCNSLHVSASVCIHNPTIVPSNMTNGNGLHDIWSMLAGLRTAALAMALGEFIQTGAYMDLLHHEHKPDARLFSPKQAATKRAREDGEDQVAHGGDSETNAIPMELADLLPSIRNWHDNGPHELLTTPVTPNTESFHHLSSDEVTLQEYAMLGQKTANMPQAQWTNANVNHVKGSTYCLKYPSEDMAKSAHEALPIHIYVDKMVSIYLTWATLPPHIASRAIHFTASPGLATASNDVIMQIVAGIQIALTDMVMEWVGALLSSPNNTLRNKGLLVQQALGEDGGPLNVVATDILTAKPVEDHRKAVYDYIGIPHHMMGSTHKQETDKSKH
eukprot:gene15487-21572_t